MKWYFVAPGDQRFDEQLVNERVIDNWRTSGAWNVVLETERMVVFHARLGAPSIHRMRIFIREDLLKKEMS